MYTITLLKNEQFNKLPYKDADISLGLADYKNKKAYVRESGIPALDVLIAGHEIHELLAKVSPHEEDGIRYKKGGAARSIVPMVLGTIVGSLTGMPWLGAVLGGLSGGGMGAYAQSNHPELGWQAPVMGAIGGAAGGYGGTNMVQGAQAGWGAAGQGASLGSKLGSAAQGAVWGTAGSGAGAQSLLGAGGKSVGLFGPGTAIGGMASSTLGKGAMSMMGNNVLQSMMSPGTQSSGQNYQTSAGYGGYNPYMSSQGSMMTQSIKSTNPVSGGFSSAVTNKDNMLSDNVDEGNSKIPGIQNQIPLLMQRNPWWNVQTMGGY